MLSLVALAPTAALTPNKLFGKGVEPSWDAKPWSSGEVQDSAGTAAGLELTQRKLTCRLSPLEFLSLPAAGLKQLAIQQNPVVGYWDPLEIGDYFNKEGIAWFRHAEIKHGRIAMAAFVGYGVQSNVHFPALLSKPFPGNGIFAAQPEVSFADIAAAGGPADQWDVSRRIAHRRPFSESGFFFRARPACVSVCSPRESTAPAAAVSRALLTIGHVRAADRRCPRPPRSRSSSPSASSSSTASLRPR